MDLRKKSKSDLLIQIMIEKEIATIIMRVIIDEDHRA